MRVLVAIVCCLVVAVFFLNEAAKRSYPPASCSDLFAGLTDSDGMIVQPCKDDQPPQAERTDIYQQSLQILSGEKLTPLN